MLDATSALEPVPMWGPIWYKCGNTGPYIFSLSLAAVYRLSIFSVAKHYSVNFNAFCCILNNIRDRPCRKSPYSLKTRKNTFQNMRTNKFAREELCSCPAEQFEQIRPRTRSIIAAYDPIWPRHIGKIADQRYKTVKWTNFDITTDTAINRTSASEISARAQQWNWPTLVCVKPSRIRRALKLLANRSSSCSSSWTLLQQRLPGVVSVDEAPPSGSVARYDTAAAVDGDGGRDVGGLNALFAQKCFSHGSLASANLLDHAYARTARITYHTTTTTTFGFYFSG